MEKKQITQDYYCPYRPFNPSILQSFSLSNTGFADSIGQV